MRNASKQRALNFQRGLSLIELMVAMGIGIFLVFGATQIYVKSRASYEVNEAVARLQETARFGMNAIQEDVLHAAYWGQFGVQFMGNGNGRVTDSAGVLDATSAIATGANALKCGNNFAVDLGNYLQGDNNGLLPNSDGGGAGFLSSSVTANCRPFNNNAVTSSDTLTIRYADPNTTLSKTLRICSAALSAQVVNDSTTCTGGLQINDLLVHAYYVDRDSTQQTGLPSLRRKELILGPDFTDTEIIPGVEDMQVQFGIEPGMVNGAPNPGVAAQYVNPNDPLLNAVDALGNINTQIVTVRVWLLVRSEAPEPGFTDNRTYEYGDRTLANGTATSLSAAGAAGKAYAPNDGYRRLLVGRTFQIRNAKLN